MVISLWRKLIVITLCITSIIYTLPSFLDQKTLQSPLFSWLPEEQISLGLDLRGGSSILLEVDIQTVMRERANNLVNEVRQSLRKNRIGYTSLNTIGAEGVTVTLRNISQKEMAYKALKKNSPHLLIKTMDDGHLEIMMDPTMLKQQEESVLNKSIEIVRRRIDEMGTKEPLIQRQGNDRILVQLPGVDDPAEAKRLIGKTAKMTFHLEADPTQRFNVMRVKEELERGGQMYSLDHTLNRQALITGEMLIDAQAKTDDQTGGWAISFVLDATGARRFADVTKKSIGKKFAIILDGKVISAPVINGPIPGGQGQITGSFSAKEAADLAKLLRAGALPAPLKVLEERTVGPDLGADSIAAGTKATLIAIVLIFAFMFLFYGGVYGGIANIALVFNLSMLVACLAFLQATLTLPGIAGIALTLGMAVDANVLIFERIREELRAGKKVTIAMNAGFHRAIGTIVDSNLTTIIGAGLLYQFGTGSIRGFAVTLTLGILISMFTAITVTRTIMGSWLKWFGPNSLSFGFKGGKQ